MSHRTSLEERLRTYHGWPSGSCQDPQHLAAAGFEYEGTGDSVRCPSCRLRLFDWIHSDPLEQHGKFSEYKCNMYKCIRDRLGYNSRQAYSNIANPTGDGQLHAAQTSSQRDRRVVAPETTSGDDEGALNRSQATTGATAGLMRDQVQPNVHYSSECVDVEPPRGSERLPSESHNDQPRNGHESDATYPVVIMVPRGTTVEGRVQHSMPRGGDDEGDSTDDSCSQSVVNVHGVSTSGGRSCTIEQCTDGGHLISVAGRHDPDPQSVRRAARNIGVGRRGPR